MLSSAVNPGATGTPDYGRLEERDVVYRAARRLGCPDRVNRLGVERCECGRGSVGVVAVVGLIQKVVAGDRRVVAERRGQLRPCLDELVHDPVSVRVELSHAVMTASSSPVIRAGTCRLHPSTSPTAALRPSRSPAPSQERTPHRAGWR